MNGFLSAQGSAASQPTPKISAAPTSSPHACVSLDGEAEPRDQAIAPARQTVAPAVAGSPLQREAAGDEEHAP